MLPDRNADGARRPGRLGRLFRWLAERINGPLHEAVLQALEVRPGDAVIEVGFGNGAFAELLLRNARLSLFAGVDPSPAMVERARDRLGPFIRAARLDLRRGGDAALDWPSQSFDRAVAIDMLRSWPRPDRTLRRLARLLRPGGRLVLAVREPGADPPAWLPNPFSDTADPAGEAARLLERAGFRRVTDHGRIGYATVLCAEA